MSFSVGEYVEIPGGQEGVFVIAYVHNRWPQTTIRDGRSIITGYADHLLLERDPKERGPQSAAYLVKADSVRKARKPSRIRRK